MKKNKWILLWIMAISRLVHASDFSNSYPADYTNQARFSGTHIRVAAQPQAWASMQTHQQIDYPGMELQEIIRKQPRSPGGSITITSEMMEAVQRDSELEELSRGLLPDERELLMRTQEPEEKVILGNRLRDGKFGINLFKDKRDQLAARLYTDSGTNSGLGNLGWLYADDRIGLNLHRDQRYERAMELLKRANRPCDLDKIGDMYCDGKYPGAKISVYSNTNYQSWPNQAKVYYKQSDTGYGWYRRGKLHSDNMHLAKRCFEKAEKKGIE